MAVKVVRGNPNYAVSDAGKVYSISEAGLTELRKDISNGYARVKLNGKKCYVASLVADAFLSPPEDESLRLFYVDGDHTNCSKENLMWLTQSEIKKVSRYTTEYREKILRGGA